MVSKTSHQREHQQEVTFNEGMGNVLKIARQEYEDSGMIFHHFVCPYCLGAHYNTGTSLTRHMKKCPDKPLQAPIVQEEHEEPEYVLFFFFLFFLFMDLENFVPCSLFCPPVNPVNPHSRAERLLAASSCLFFHLIMASDLRLLNGPVTNWDQILHTENQLAMTTLMSFSVNVPKGR